MSSKEIRLEQSADGRLAQLKIERPPVHVLRVSDLETFAALLRDVVGEIHAGGERPGKAGEDEDIGVA